MSDVFTPEQRSRVMAAVRSKNTTPELRVAKALRAAGIRYRGNVKRLPGSPDFVLREADVAIFVHGCFWHGHTCPRGSRTPKQNRAYWTNKIERNQKRDRRVTRQLRQRGYAVLTAWECRIRTQDDLERFVERVDRAVERG